MISYLVMIQNNKDEQGVPYIEKKNQAVAEHVALNIYRKMHVKVSAVVRVDTHAKFKGDRFQVVYKLERLCGCRGFQREFFPEGRVVCVECGAVVDETNRELVVRKAMMDLEEVEV